MNDLSIYTLKTLKKVYSKTNKSAQLTKPVCKDNPEEVSKKIFDMLMQDKPCMIARFGSTELNTLVNYLGVKQKNRNILTYISGKSLPWWWNEKTIEQMQKWSGFFPPSQDEIEKFCEMMMSDMQEVDILGSWQTLESYFEPNLIHAMKVELLYLDPYWAANPWTRALENKNILIIHPFKNTILRQYDKRETLFKNKDVLPKFKKINVIKAVQSLSDKSNNENEFDTWFDALEYMKNEINKYDFDICLIGCGAYGFPLAAYVKQLGKKAVHIGGSLQLLFGIRGNRWDNKKAYYEKDILIDYAGLVNNNWVRPSEEEKPKTHNIVESSCYW